MKLCKCKLLVMLCFIYSWKKWFYFTIYKVYCKQVDKLFFWCVEQINLFYIIYNGKYDSVFEQLSRTNCVHKPRFECLQYIFYFVICYLLLLNRKTFNFTHASGGYALRFVGTAVGRNRFLRFAIISKICNNF